MAVELAAVVRLDPVAVAEHHGAQPRRVETLVVRAQSGGAGPQLLVRFDGKTCDGARKQQLRVERRGFGQIGQQRTVPFDAGAAVDERVGHPVHARPHGGPGRNERMLVEDQDPEFAEPLVARGRQRHVVRHAERQRVRSGHDVEQEREVAGGARHRTDDGEVEVGRQCRRGRRDHTAVRRQPESRLVCVDAAEMRGGAQRTGDVGADGQRAESGRQGRR